MSDEVSIPKDVDDLYQKHTRLPSSVPEHKMPPFGESRFWAFMWDRVFSWIGFPHVRVSRAPFEMDTVYRFEFVVFGMCTHRWHVRPFGAYTLGLTLVAVLSNPVFPKGHPIVFQTLHGWCYVPRWAVSVVINNLAAICNEHDDHIKAVLKELSESNQKKTTEDEAKKAA
jgi:hypothetical protein